MRPILFQKPSPRRSAGAVRRRRTDGRRTWRSPTQIAVRGARREDTKTQGDIALGGPAGAEDAKRAGVQRDHALGSPTSTGDTKCALMGQALDAGAERDSAVGRAREAGGPEDQATYVCGCGFLFNASVSTTVACPHCGCQQAW
jgi:hypothetical protein